jgi:hypothetical protein
LPRWFGGHQEIRDQSRASRSRRGQACESLDAYTSKGGFIRPRAPTAGVFRNLLKS